MTESLQIRIQNGDGPTVIYLPGTHGDWTLNTGFRREINGSARLVEFTFPRTQDWSLVDHVQAIEQKLVEAGIGHGWILAESFASQVAWAWVDCNSKQFQIDGIILAGGFVRHPVIPAVKYARWLTLNMPRWMLRGILRQYVLYARIREGDSPEKRAALEEFVQRRTREDLLAAAHRLNLIEMNDFRRVASASEVPVYYLTGMIDPIVPWPFVHLWLKRNCRSYRDWKLVWASDHHVLGAAKQSASQILRWTTL